ncbi:MAG: Outer membrane protein assembly factor BamA [Chlamydiia bacterium]|nr:Outer membrane protein assembly factor BamA [Chlamydiia bacterium]
MKNRFFSLLLPLLLISSNLLRAEVIEEYEGKKIEAIHVTVEQLPPGAADPESTILQGLNMKAGDPFNQLLFDQDLKELSGNYESVNPQISVDGDKVVINLVIREKPKISDIEIAGNNRVKAKKILKESELKAGTVFTREEIYKAVNKITEMYVKKGYFEVQVNYEIVPEPANNEVVIKLNIREGRSGRINKIVFEGFSPKEERELVNMIHSRKYNVFTSWLTGNGCYRGDEQTDPDTVIITHYLQNQGYADAKVKISLRDLPYKKIALVIQADKGQLYHIGNISVEGSELFDKESVVKSIGYKSGSVFSNTEIRNGAIAIKDNLYGQQGYIETNVQYSLHFRENEPVCDVVYDIDESSQYRVGLVKVLGNRSTQSKVILNQSNIHPCQVFDQTKLKATQENLQSMGFFKSVNVYPVKNTDDKALGSCYRDVVIEVDEAQTGNVSMFFGLSSTDSIFGGLDLTENNFNHEGVSNWWKKGASSFRGAGEYLHVRGALGQKVKEATVSWLNPYFMDSLWRFGFDVGYTHTDVIAKDYNLHTLNGTIYASHPYSSFVSYGWKARAKNQMVHISQSAGPVAVEQEDNNGMTAGFGTNLSYDSTNNPFRPSRGIRSNMDVELAGVSRHTDFDKDFLFAKMRYINSGYYPLWEKGTLKARADLQFILPFFGVNSNDLPLDERFFLGGEQTIRGYKPNIIGPVYRAPDGDEDNPTGGISSVLLSLEYAQKIARPLDLFVFLDGGSISPEKWDINTLRMSYGIGVRLDIGRQLPIMVGYGVPINPERPSDVKNVFFSMGGQF